MVNSWKIKRVIAGLRGLYALNIRRNPDNFFPPLLSIKLTDRCNYRCITCNSYEIGDKENELTLQQLQAILRSFKQMRGLSVRFTGGEPFLRKDIYPLISCAKLLDLRVAIATNGSFLTEEHLNFIKKECVNHITISLHGKEQIHDSIVGVKGSWKTLDGIIKRMKYFDLPVDLAFTIVKRNIREIEDIVKYAKELDISVGFNISDSNPYFFRSVNETIFPSPEEMKSVASVLIGLKKKYPKHINGSIEAFKEIPALVQDSRLSHYYCARTVMELCVDSFGNVYPGCWVMGGAGNLKNHTLYDIFYSRDYIRKRQKGFMKECPGCTCGYALDILMNVKRRF